MNTLFALLFIAILAALWQGHLAAREAAVAAARDLCRKQDHQFLDGSVVLAGTRLVRQARGFPSVRRVFQFAYSPEGTTRHIGFVIMLGSQLDSIGL